MSEATRGRHFVADQIGGQVPERTAHEMQLATSELVTNALQHGLPAPIIVTVHVNGGQAWVRVANESPTSATVPQLDDWNMSDHGRLNGRGLGIVKAISD